MRIKKNVPGSSNSIIGHVIEVLQCFTDVASTRMSPDVFGCVRIAAFCTPRARHIMCSIIYQCRYYLLTRMRKKRDRFLPSANAPFQRGACSGLSIIRIFVLVADRVGLVGYLNACRQ